MAAPGRGARGGALSPSPAGRRWVWEEDQKWGVGAPPRWGAGGYPCKGFGPFSAALVSGKQEAAEIGRLQLWQGQGHSRAVCVSVCVHVCVCYLHVWAPTTGRSGGPGVGVLAECARGEGCVCCVCIQGCVQGWTPLSPGPRHSNVRFEPQLQPTPQLMATLDPELNERGQGSNLQPHGY